MVPYNDYKMKKILITVVFVQLFLVSCSKDEGNYKPRPLILHLPSNSPNIAYNLENNPLTEEGFELGKALFYAFFWFWAR